jgi:4-diphosphocytidyl-2-C-methyl-D-erythritol kinase
MGGTVAATGRGDRLTPLPPLPATWFVLVHPNVTVSTTRAYASHALTRNSERPFAGRTRSFRSALRALEAGRIADAVFNRMEDAVFPGNPGIANIKRRLIEAGCLAAAMSGSGSTVFGVCTSRTQATRTAEGFADLRTSVVCSVPAAVERLV